MIDLGLNVYLVTRPEWGARPPRSVTHFTPGYGSTTHWEGPYMGNFGHDQCASKVRSIQNYHMNNQGWSDIAYSAVACPHGYVYEGRWIGVRTAANGTTQGNSSAYAVCYLGGQGNIFTEDAKRAIRVTQDVFFVHGDAGPYRNCHRDWKATACPGDEICHWVRLGQPITYPTPSPEPTPPPPPILHKEDDMYFVECFDVNVGIWCLTGDNFFHIVDHRTVGNSENQGVKRLSWAKADFDTLAAEKGKEEELLAAIEANTEPAPEPTPDLPPE